LTQFSDFGLADPILAALTSEGYDRPTPIQSQAITPVMAGRDLCGIAQTGTGKTAAFALPLLHRLAGNPRRMPAHAPRTLVLAPTRELAAQIAESFRTYAGTLPIDVQVVFGGVAIGRQERALMRAPDVLVATPGRLLDLVDRGSCRLDMVEALVLDEADQMLDLGFIHALKKIAKLLPKKRQTLFFSATMPKAIADLAAGYLTDPVQVAVAPVAATVDRVEQSVYFCETKAKQALLEHLLVDPAFERVIVFTRTKHGADRVVKSLDRAGLEAVAIHGNKSQPQREKALAAFKSGQIRVLVATDIAARGIDIDDVSHVINYELPNIPESYVHRIGRTARAGNGGIAVSFCNDEERAYLKTIEKLTRRTVAVTTLPKGLRERAAEIARQSKATIDDDDLRREPRRHAGRPSDERRGGERRGPKAAPRTAEAGPRGPRGPREEFRGRDETRRDDARRPEGRREDNRWADEVARRDGRRTDAGPNRGHDGERNRNEAQRRDDRVQAPPKAMRDTRHGEPIGAGRRSEASDHVRFAAARDQHQGERKRAPAAQGAGPRRGSGRPQRDA
jgi:ATP-dependent RNA helicase RhlE